MVSPARHSSLTDTRTQTNGRTDDRQGSSQTVAAGYLKHHQSHCADRKASDALTVVCSGYLSDVTHTQGVNTPTVTHGL